ncbi:MAG: hypothetical protein HXX10_23165 [Rhodoplanes sp.]|uniref:hypothetical protein n=1 Tax=Rhodoplanes sp. TaxID=1968906 RepID=UPI00181B44A4|nr:hypothetical protein [Rhodoplanes sp.]NVO16937.1 hypothetical protein [Rhodoplanes sp.]
MLEGLVLRWQAKVDAVVKSGLWVAVATFALLVSFAFLGAALFIWAQEIYGAIRTCLGFAAFFLALALIAVIGLLVFRRSVWRREARIAQQAAHAAPPAWLDPQVLSTVLSLGKTLGPRRAAWIGLVGAFAVGLLLSRGADKR